MTISFQTDILPLFRPVDVNHMKPMGVLLNDYGYLSDPTGDSTYPDHTNARTVYCYLTGDCQPQMPIGGPFWTPVQLQLFQQWMTDDFQP